MPALLPTLLAVLAAHAEPTAHAVCAAQAAPTESTAQVAPTEPTEPTGLADGLADGLAERVAPFVDAWCARCHGASEPEAGLDLTRAELLRAGPERAAAAETWRLARELLAWEEMPPRAAPQPSAAERAAVVAALDAAFGAPESGERALDPGRPTLRRLNRTEFENTVLDLVGVAYPAAELLPPDGVGHGFDTIGAVLSMPEVLLEKHLVAAETIADAAVVLPADGPPPVIEATGAELEATRRAGRRKGFGVLASAGALRLDVLVERAGEFEVRVTATAQQAGPELARMDVLVDGARVERFEVRERAPDETGVYRARTRLEAGEHALDVAFANDYYRPEEPDPAQRDRNLWIAAVAVEGPLDAAAPTPFQARLAAEHPDVEDAVRALASRAWRRPATDEEVGRLLRLTERGDAWERRVRDALVALLVSPHFLYRVEVDPPNAQAVHPVSDFELATRLSYFLWSSLPDAELFAAAAAGRLAEPAELRAQTDRMLRDPRASALARGFAAQWLQTRNLDQVSPDPRRFPGFDAELAEAMRLETELFFEAVLREERPLAELLDADFTFVNERLAAHYGLPGVRGAHLRRVAIPPALRDRRGGVLGAAGVLTVTSNPTRTSPVLRGKWVLETLLDAPPPPPPPGLGDLPDGPEAARAASLRERLEEHRSDPSCAVCHATMDALGFGLEPYDAVGAWRESDGEHAIDATGELPDGRAFDGPAELRRLLAADPDFTRAVAKKLLVYALGRGLDRADAPLVAALLADLPPDPTVADLVRAVVATDAFRLRRRAEEDA